jgi:hypothetical protein
MLMFHSLHFVLFTSVLHLCHSQRNLFNQTRPLTTPPEARIQVAFEKNERKETVVRHIPFYSSVGNYDNKDGTIMALNQIIQYEHDHNNSYGLQICMKSTGWCTLKNEIEKCHKLYRENKPTCRSITFHDTFGFAISIKGRITVQFTIIDKNGYLLATSKLATFESESGLIMKNLSKKEYFQKFEREEKEHPFGEFYYGIFNELIQSVFVTGETGSNLLVPWNECSSTPIITPIVPLNVVEIGVARAGHSSKILSGLDNSVLNKLYGVDPYLSFYDADDIFAAKGQLEFDAMHEWVQSRLEKEEIDRHQSNRFELLRTTSTKAVQLLSDVSIHAVFVDGDHRASAVLEDLLAWYPKIIPGGLIAGDDYHLPGVAEGVQLFLNTFDETKKPVIASVGVVEHYQLFALTKPCH